MYDNQTLWVCLGSRRSGSVLRGPIANCFFNVQPRDRSQCRIAPVESETASDESTAAKLPVRRVILYKTGVGYFEHLGRIQNDQSIRIDFTSGQLNDVLQSLTILDLNGGRIAGVNYNSEAPLSQRLSTLRLPLEETTDSRSFMVPCAERGWKSVSGKIRDHRASAQRGTENARQRRHHARSDLATLVSDAGEVHSVELTPASASGWRNPTCPAK